tara:strand:+ start:267 stop:899 length:633 start_codon:yes stop_codon:yes gene_type:complete
VIKLNHVYQLQESFFKHYADNRLCPKVEHIDDWLKDYDPELVYNALKYTLQEEANSPIGFISYLLKHPKKIRLAAKPVKEPAVSYSMVDLQRRIAVAGSIEVRDQDNIHRLTIDVSDLDWISGINQYNVDHLNEEEMYRLFWIYYQKDFSSTAGRCSRAYCIVRWYPRLFGPFIQAGYADWLRRCRGLTVPQVEGSDFITAPIAEVASVL